jgi:hypothetical protein
VARPAKAFHAESWNLHSTVITRTETRRTATGHKLNGLNGRLTNDLLKHLVDRTRMQIQLTVESRRTSPVETKPCEQLLQLSFVFRKCLTVNANLHNIWQEPRLTHSQAVASPGVALSRCPRRVIQPATCVTRFRRNTRFNRMNTIPCVLVERNQKITRRHNDGNQGICGKR